ncbi:MAG: tRNA pseudouridine(55) synthase TruB [Clostridium sp.]|uniref:tRNA pseudouridine(55) synthase TruB n=1 Tax=Clostridium sp. TaxID=1506 RepID=UPI002A890C72|nr:tRNA pseudouridine(55) synthase TruB [Clostridium sp.]MDY5098186.1 tRNA pseudouridine(55) synthase TruB [Clostridium sp.]
MDGIINVFKPKGISSFQVVRAVRSISGEKKVGHTGTLDPLASGVLPICLGKGTKIIEYIMENQKVYKATLKLGEETDTYDLEGTVISSKEVGEIPLSEVEKVLESYIGEIDQIPPMYSALKVDGKRLYELARKGIEVEREARKITIYDIELLKYAKPFITIRVRCSKGTYIRSLCKDIGDSLKCGAVMTELVREGSGVFNTENSIELEALTKDNFNNYLISLEDALRPYEKILVNDKFFKLLLNGVSIKDKAIFNDKIESGKLYRVYSNKDELLGLGEKTSDGFKLIKLLF